MRTSLPQLRYQRGAAGASGVTPGATRQDSARSSRPSDQDERRPEVGMKIPRSIDQLELGVAQGLGPVQPRLEMAVEAHHQVRGRLVVHLPQADHEAGSTRVQERARHPDQSFAGYFFAQSALTCRQYHEVGLQLQVEDLTHLQQPILGRTGGMRQPQPRELRMTRIEQAMSSEMEDVGRAHESAALDVLFARRGPEEDHGLIGVEQPGDPAY